MLNLNDKVALVTGSTKGIGRAIAETLANLGAAVIINSSNSPELGEELASALRTKGMAATYMGADITKKEEVNIMVKEIVKTYGKIDILINNVGKTQSKPILAMSPANFDEMYELNLKSSYHCINAVIKPMLMKRFGRIINISSTAGTNGMPFEAHYSAAKSGLIGLSKAIAKEMGPKGITCNVVAPGIIATEKNKLAMDDKKRNVLDTIPLRREGSPEDVVGVVAFLASDYAAYITGQVIKVDGGLFI